MATDSTCPKCGGAGFIIVERGSISGARKCECMGLAHASRLEGLARIPPLYSEASIDALAGNFVLPKDNPNANRDLTKVLVTVRAYAENFPDEKRPGLLLIGDPGTGKTHLAVGALRQILARGFEGLFYDYQTLLNNIKSSYDPASDLSSKEAFRSALDAQVLLLDDLGAQKITGWVEDTVTSIITHRGNQRKPLIATTNLPDGDAGSSIVTKSALDQPTYRKTLAEHIGPRARSRLFEMCTVVRMPNVADYRIKTGKIF